MHFPRFLPQEYLNFGQNTTTLTLKWLRTMINKISIIKNPDKTLTITQKSIFRLKYTFFQSKINTATPPQMPHKHGGRGGVKR